MEKRSRILTIGALVAAGLGAPAVAQQAEHFTAWAISMSNVAAGANSQVDIVIERWSSDAERQQLIQAFSDKGQDGLLKALQKIKPPVGHISLPGRLSWDLQYAREVKGEEGGRRILIATDRKMGFAEVSRSARTVDYPFTLIELHLDKDGNGEGRASVMTKVSWNKKQNVLELENYSSEPVRLKEVRKAKD